MKREYFLGVDCGSVSLNLVLLGRSGEEPHTIYRRTRGRPLDTFVSAIKELERGIGNVPVGGALVTGSGRELIADSLGIPAINEITAHSTGAYRVDQRIRTIIEIGGQDSKFIRIEPSERDDSPRIVSFRMNEVCAAGTGAFLDEQASRLGIPVESFGEIASGGDQPAPIAGRCAVFAKTDMIHKAQEGALLPDILAGVAFALARNYIGALIRGDSVVPPVSLQGGVMANGAVVKAFRELLGLTEDELIIPPHFKVIGALGCAVTARKSPLLDPLSLLEFREAAVRKRCSSMETVRSAPLVPARNGQCEPAFNPVEKTDPQPPFIMGLDVGSVSVKGVVIDSHGVILAEDYRLSKGRPLDSLDEVLEALSAERPAADVLAVTGSGRSLAGRLIDADLIVNEISAQLRAALSRDPNADTIVEIGGQDSKWISIENGLLKDFEMNRVCAAGTGSFLMEQADRLGLPMGREFSDTAFSSSAPSDLGTRCTVFMQSDLIHHQNNGASRADLAAGVCVSIVRNYLERVANHKPLGDRVMFLGGVAANPAVRAAFERHTGKSFQSPGFFRVSGALGAALKALDAVRAAEMVPKRRGRTTPELRRVRKDTFTCKNCDNHCRIDRFRPGHRVVFHGGRCDRWEADDRSNTASERPDPFRIRTHLLETVADSGSELKHAEPEDRLIDSRPLPRSWGMVRSPQFYEWFPFWKAFCDELGISLVVAPPPRREQFEQGTRFLRVETCLPMKVMAGQIRDLVRSGVNTIFHPAVLSEEPPGPGGRPTEHCPYIQASSQFFKGAFDVDWKEPVVSYELDPDSFRNEHLRFAEGLGISRARARRAFRNGLEEQNRYRRHVEEAGRGFLDSLGTTDRALIVLGKPYHTADPFLNMNLSGLFHRLGIRAMPGDIFPLSQYPTRSPIAWKLQLRMIGTARAIARDPRLFPVMITFFGCGPDPFTMRHIRESLKGKPLLMLEMDEHSSRAGLLTRLEAFMDHVNGSVARESRAANAGRSTRGASLNPSMSSGWPVQKPSSSLPEHSLSRPRPEETATPRSRQERKPGNAPRSRRVDTIYIPHFGDHSYAFAGAAGSFGIDARVLPAPDDDSARLGRPHLMGGECHPYALILGDYLKLARDLPPEKAKRSLFSVPGYSACRLGQYPVYMEKVRKECGYSMRVIADLSQALTAFGLSKKNRDLVVLRTWAGLTAFDALLQVYLKIRPLTGYPDRLERLHSESRDTLFRSLCAGEVEKGMEDALHIISRAGPDEDAERPVVAVTGDYYTRVVSFANNNVYLEIERLGGTVLPPPTFSDGLKAHYLREIMGGTLPPDSREFAEKSAFYAALVLSELRIKGSLQQGTGLTARLDPLGLRARKFLAPHLDSRFPPGMAAPLATALEQVAQGVNGVLNLITLNCSYGTVVTAALSRALKERPDIPMLTLVYDGLKKTNEKTRVEAFMEQVRDSFQQTK